MNYYDKIAKGYEELHKEEQLKKVELIKKHFKVKKSDKLLDVGCGTGLTTEPWECQRFGIDPSEKLIEKAREKNSKIEYALASAEKIPFPDNHFDVVISITAIQNFNHVENGLKEIKRVGINRFVLSFLKKSQKKAIIERLIKELFNVKQILEEDKDLIYLV